MLTALALLLTAPFAHAQDTDDPTWYAGRIISSVELVAGTGSLRDEDLRPLLRATESQPLDPTTLQLDLRTLFRVAPLAAIEADVSPWPTYDPRIDDITVGVRVRYVLYLAPTIHEIRIQGEGDVRRRQILNASRLSEGDPFEPDQDAAAVEARLIRYLQAEGYPDAEVEVEAFPRDLDDPLALEVWLRVDPGPPRLLDQLNIQGVPQELSERRIRRWARQAGLRERRGWPQRARPVSEDALTRARFQIRRKMARVGGGQTLESLVTSRGVSWLTDRGVLPRGGWVEASVRVESEELEDRNLRVDLTIDAGKRLVLQARGMRTSVAREALGVDERLRLTRGFMEQAEGRIEEHMERRGYPDAKAEVKFAESPQTRTLNVVVDPGHRYRRKPIRFTGNDALTETQLRTVMNQASPEVIRKRRLTRPALERGLQAIRDIYRSVGHDEISFTYGEARIQRRRAGFSLDRSRRWHIQEVHITEGARTLLRELDLIGPSPDVDISPYQAALERLVDGPYSPQALQGLSMRIVEAHRAAGYLDARAEVKSEQLGERSYRSRITITPGDRVLLRSFATRGNRRVSPQYLRRTLSPPLGRPLDSQTLDDLRQRLYDLGMFSGVELSLVGDEAARDLLVELREKPRHTIEAGFGLASDQGVRALGRWTVRNLFGSADRIDTNALVGLRVGASGQGLIFRAPEYRLGSMYSVPISREFQFSLNLVGQEEIQERNWRLLRRAIGLQWSYQPRRSTLVQLRTNLEHRRLNGADPGALLKADVWADPALRLPSTPSVDTRGRLVDQLELIWLDDHRDNPLQPTRGYLGSTRLAFSPQMIQPGYARHLRAPTLAAEARAAAVIPVGPLSLRLNAEGGHQRVVRIGNIATYNLDGQEVRIPVPVEERYRLGGTASLRGFRRDGVGAHQQVRQLDLAWPDALGPIVADTLRLDDSRWVPTGGDTFARATADLLIPLPVLGLADWEGYDLALFMDLGQTWFVLPSAVTPSRGDAPWIRGAAGVGLRVLTPVGPLQTDLAFNPQPQRHLNEPIARLHLSLGTLF